MNEESTWANRMPFQEVPSGCMTAESPLKVLAKLIQVEFGGKNETTTPSVPQWHTTTNEREAAAGRGDRLRKETQRERNWQSFSSIDGVSHGSRGGELTERNPLKMAKHQEVEHIAKQLDKMVHKKNTVSAKQLLHQHKTRDQVVNPNLTAERDNSGNTLFNSAHWPVEELNVCW